MCTRLGAGPRPSPTGTLARQHQLATRAATLGLHHAGCFMQARTVSLYAFVPHALVTQAPGSSMSIWSSCRPWAALLAQAAPGLRNQHLMPGTREPAQPTNPCYNIPFCACTLADRKSHTNAPGPCHDTPFMSHTPHASRNGKTPSESYPQPRPHALRPSASADGTPLHAWHLRSYRPPLTAANQQTRPRTQARITCHMSQYRQVQDSASRQWRRHTLQTHRNATAL